MKPTENWGISAVLTAVFLLLAAGESRGQTKLAPMRIAYSALSAGIGVLWLTHEQGIFRNMAWNRIWCICEAALLRHKPYWPVRSSSATFLRHL